MVAVEAVQGRPVKRGAEPHAALVLGEEVKALVGVFGKTKSGEESRRFLGLLLVAAGAGGLKVHLAIGPIDERKLTGRTFGEEVPRDFGWLVGLRQCESRERQ